jgi:hypothetical protein
MADCIARRNGGMCMIILTIGAETHSYPRRCPSAESCPDLCYGREKPAGVQSAHRIQWARRRRGAEASPFPPRGKDTLTDC